MRGDLDHERDSSRWLGAVVPRVVLVLATLAVFAPSCRLPLLVGWDDNVYVTENAARLVFSAENCLHWLTHGCLRHYLPATMFSYMLDYNLWGLNAVGYHCQSLFWHVIAVLGVFHCFLFFKMNRWVAALAALAFAVHPQRAESVVWISERKDVLCAAFYFWSLFFYFRARERGSFPGVSLFLFLLSMLSKPMAVTMPLVLLCFEFHRNRSLARPMGAGLWSFFLAAAVFVPITLATQVTRPIPFEPARRAFVVLHNVAWTVASSLVPLDLNPMYPRVYPNPAAVMGTGVFFLAITVVLVAFWLKRPKIFRYDVAPLTLAFLFSLAPVVGLVAWSTIDRADRYGYIPSAFLWFGVGMILTRCRPQRWPVSRRLAALGLAMVYVVYLGSRTLFHAETWGSYRKVLTMVCLRPDPNFAALIALANLELASDRPATALRLAERVLTPRGSWIPAKDLEETKIKATMIKTLALDRLGRRREAREVYLEIKPLLNVEFFDSASRMKAFKARMESSPTAPTAPNQPKRIMPSHEHH